MQATNPYLDHLIDSSFQGICRLFVLSFKNNNDNKGHRKYFFPKVEIKDYNVMIDGQNVFYQLVKNDMRTFDNIQKIVTGQRDDYTIACWIDYPYFKEYYKIIVNKKHLMLI